MLRSSGGGVACQLAGVWRRGTVVDGRSTQPTTACGCVVERVGCSRTDGTPHGRGWRTKYEAERRQ